MNPMDIATVLHAGQRDKAGKPYILHPFAVAQNVWATASEPEYDDLRLDIALDAAYLHDVLEDTGMTADGLRDLYVPEAVIEVVELLTHHRHESRDTYYARIKANPVAVWVKRCDSAHNLEPKRLAHLDEATRVRLTTKYTHALEMLS